MLFKALAAAAFLSRAAAQRPENTSICDFYTTALLMNNTAENQLTLLTLLVNTAVIGNYTQPNHNAVPGILAPGEVNGTKVDLLQYFNGSLASSNRGGSSGVSINFLDDGGAVPLTMNKPANSTTSNQYLLLTHLYEYFGMLLGCSQQGMSGYPDYTGQPSQYNVHKFMDLSFAEVTYFIDQVALSAQSFGVAASDLTSVGTALNSLFNVRLAAPATVIPAQGPHLQSICTDDTCPIAANSTMDGYTNVGEPAAANSSNMESSMSMSGTATMTGTGTATATGKSSASMTGTATGSATGASASATGGASVVGYSVMAALGGVFAFLV